MSVKPYEDEQIPVSMKSNYIERIPMICDPGTGMIMPAFQKFYDTIVECVLQHDREGLYNISDKSMEYGEFLIQYEDHVGKQLSTILHTPDNMHKVDIELNLSRFQSNQRNILGSFLINTYVLEDAESKLLEHKRRKLVIRYTELFFTYRNKKFELISSFQPLMNV